MINESGVAQIRLRGTNAQLSTLLPGLYNLAAQCSSFGSFLDESVRYLAASRLAIMTLEYHAGTREVTLLVRG
jgi:hypothetical protein